jgi:hypothetical protein
MTKKILFPMLAAAALLAFASPRPARAQECTTKCGCFGDGCGCQSSGGNGGECSASGNGCFVKKCEPVDNVGFAADGSTLLAAAAPGEGKSAAASRKSAESARWVATAPGVFVARNCAGVIVARRYDTLAAATVRKRQAALEI